MKIRSIIVDDERPARELIAALLKREPDVEVVAECSTGRDAAATIPKLRPDLVFLDVSMPGLDGFEALAQCETAPMVIFVTAHDQHAVRAFDVRAIDYVLKPVEFTRFREAVARARAAFADKSNRPAGRLAIKDGSRMELIDPAEIDWIESEGNYVCLHLGGKTQLWRETLANVESRLALRGFLRVSRSTLVNTARIRQWQPLLHGDSVLLLRDGSRLTVSRIFRANFEEWVQTLG